MMLGVILPKSSNYTYRPGGSSVLVCERWPGDPIFELATNILAIYCARIPPAGYTNSRRL